MSEVKKIRIAILGAGPSGLFIYKRLVESGNNNFTVTIFEKNNQTGAGMPYSTDGAGKEHITNVSGNEIPHLVTSIEEWIQTVPKETLERFDIDPAKFNEYKVLPRLLFGQYLTAQFGLLLAKAKESGIQTVLKTHTTVTDLIDHPEQQEVSVVTDGKESMGFDRVIICIGHRWPLKYEGIVPGYYDSPYPPSKLALQLDHAVAIKGASLTAIDAIRTLSRHNGSFQKDTKGKLTYALAENSQEFKLVMHSRSGLLPAIRFHLEDSHLSHNELLGPEEIRQNIIENDGFLSLDFVFDKDFKEMFREKDPAFYDRIRDMNIETFVDYIMEFREKHDPFQLFRAEYVEAEKSIERQESIYWKEMLAVLSFAMNYPAKYFSAEDMLRLQKVLMPLISIVIAFVPQSSAVELIALNEAGVLDLVAVGDDSIIDVEPGGGVKYHYTDEDGNDRSVFYRTFIDCAGQPHLQYDDFPFKSLLKTKSISPARLRFKLDEEGRLAIKNGNKKVEEEGGVYYLKVPGITITDRFQVVDHSGEPSDRIYIMAVPYIGGYNPDYSGLDFCQEASARIANHILQLPDETV